MNHKLNIVLISIIIIGTILGTTAFIMHFTNNKYNEGYKGEKDSASKGQENAVNNRSLNDIAHNLNQLVPSQSNYGGTGDKGDWYHDYLDYYERILDQLPVNFKLLEIGVSGGYSIVSFVRKYNEALVYGIDIDLGGWNHNRDMFKLTQNEVDRLHVRKQDATQDDVVGKLPNDLDVILDDGSHQPEDIKKTFNLLFPNNLKKGGTYIIEDIHCNDYPFPFMDYVKELLPFVYKFSNFKECRMLKGRNEIENRISLDWRYSIKDITFTRDIIIIRKDTL